MAGMVSICCTRSLMARSYLTFGDAIDGARIGAIAVFSRGDDPAERRRPVWAQHHEPACDGAGAHCHEGAMYLLHQTVFNFLAETLR